MKVYQKIAATCDALTRCPAGHQCRDQHFATLRSIEEGFLPNGCGFDSGTQILLSRSMTPTFDNQIVMVSAYHKMVEGAYIGWVEFNILVKPHLIGEFDAFVTITSGREVASDSDIEYFIDCFHGYLDTEFEA